MKTSELRYWLQRFFQEDPSGQRNVSQATISAYRDTFRLLLLHWRTRYRSAGHALSLDALTPDAILKFLEHLEVQRRNSVPTRNARLAAIRSFVHYLVDWVGPELPATVPRILAIPFKRHAQSIKGFLSRQEIEAILGAAGHGWTGRRNHLLFLLLYNTGARISEVLNLRPKDVSADAKQVEILGKGRKNRPLPVWPQTRTCLRQWIRENRISSEAPLLSNRFGQRLTRAGAAHQLQQMVQRASTKLPALMKRQISPHTFRHSLAMHLLETGVATEVIALLLGHESPRTTHIYVEASLTMKRNALEQLSPPTSKPNRFKPTDDLLRFLEGL